MKLTKDQQIIMLCDAARASSMDGHIVSEPPPSTMAERVMTWLGGRKNTPRKNSYLYLDSVDACSSIPILAPLPSRLRPAGVAERKTSTDWRTLQSS